MKLHRILLALVAVFAFGAVLAATASAETTLLASWLISGVEPSVLTSVEIKGSLLLEDTETLAGKASVICKGTLDGTVGPNGEDEITEVLNAAGEKVEEGGGTKLGLLGTGAKAPDCEATQTCAEGTAASAIEVWPIGLPWHTLLFLMEPTKEILDLVTANGKNFGYLLKCLVVGLAVEDECTATDGELLLVNSPVTGDAITPLGSEVTPRANCSMSGKASGVNIAATSGIVTDLLGLLVTVSSEP